MERAQQPAKWLVDPVSVGFVEPLPDRAQAVVGIEGLSRGDLSKTDRGYVKLSELTRQANFLLYRGVAGARGRDPQDVGLAEGENCIAAEAQQLSDDLW
jgi:hypothetical protein